MGLFRNKALTKLSSPEQLDQLIQVISPRHWIALLAIAIVVFIALLSLVYGNVPISISGDGIITNPKGVQRIVAEQTGFIKNVRPLGNNQVVKDQLLAEIRPLALDIEDNGSVTPNTDNKSEYVKVTSPDSGNLISFWAEENDYVKCGDTIGAVETLHENPDALIFIPISIGKQIKPGMRVEVTPSIITNENFGYIVGEVVEVGQYPLTKDSLIGYLRNETLAERFLDRNMPIMVYVKLLKDPNTPSGYKWSTGTGPQIKISNETLCSVKIIIGEVKPISFFLPNS